MNNVVRQNPWSLMPRLQDEINRLFGSMGENNDSSSATAAWCPVESAGPELQSRAP